MNKAYQTMREFWLDVNNLQHKKEVPQLGKEKICVAGVEMAAADEKEETKRILIVASSLGNASLYFENNSPSGLGGMTGGAASGPIREKALRMMRAASMAGDELQEVIAMPAEAVEGTVTLFAVTAEGKLRAAKLLEADVRKEDHSLYEFFAYSQQLLGAFRTEQEAAAAPAKTAVSAAETSSKTAVPSDTASALPSEETETE